MVKKSSKERNVNMELQGVIDYARNEHKSDLAKQIAEKLVLLGAENIKYVKEGKYSFNHGMNVGQSKALSWVLEQVKESEETQHVNETCKESDNSLTQEPVSEDLENAAERDVCKAVNECSATGIPNDHIPSWVQDAMINEFIHGAQWQKEKTMAKAIDAHCFGFQGDALFSFTLPADNYLVGSQVKVIIYK